MKKKAIFILCTSLVWLANGQSLSPATIGQTGNMMLATNNKSLSYGVNHLSVVPVSDAKLPQNTRDASKGDCLTIYPNPASDNLFVDLQFEGEGVAYCLIYDSWGKKITDFSTQINATGTITKRLNIATLATGNYLLSMIFTPAKGNKQTLTKRFEVVH